MQHSLTVTILSVRVQQSVLGYILHLRADHEAGFFTYPFLSLKNWKWYCMGSCASYLKGICQIHPRPQMVIEPLFVQAYPPVVSYNFSVIFFFRLNNGVLGVIHYAVTLSYLSDIEVVFCFPCIITHRHISERL